MLLSSLLLNRFASEDFGDGLRDLQGAPVIIFAHLMRQLPVTYTDKVGMVRRVDQIIPNQDLGVGVNLLSGVRLEHFFAEANTASSE